MSPVATRVLEAYEKALTEIAQRLAGSDDPNEAVIGARLLVCAACNHRTYDQPCGNCELGQSLCDDDQPMRMASKG